MSYNRVWIHCVWTTQGRIPFLKEDIRKKVQNHILDNAKTKGIYIDHLNGYEEHMHAFISLGSNQKIAEIMQKLKGESSFWINKQNLTRLKFQWQDDFYCVSIEMPQLDNLRKYIRNQQQHHTTTNVQEEIDSLIKEDGLVRVKD